MRSRIEYKGKVYPFQFRLNGKAHFFNRAKPQSRILTDDQGKMELVTIKPIQRCPYCNSIVELSKKGYCPCCGEKII